jgi:hypothetical protein
MLKWLVLVWVVAACGTNGPDYIAGFDPPAAEQGYTRFVTPIVKDIAPGADVEYCQWVAAPAAATKDILDFTGKQSATGHHAILYATTETNFPVGESHICTEDDMLSISYIGGIGGEGVATGKLPSGIYPRLREGLALMADTHWLNATDKTVDGQAALDVEFAAPDDSRTIADVYANVGDTFSIPPGVAYSYDANCPIPQDINLAMAGDHMHGNGTSAYSELVHADGTKTSLVTDPSWTPEQQFNANYVTFGTTSPMVAHAGDTYHTHCEWFNATSSPILFPAEMCVGFAFYFPGNGQITCDDGSWGAASTAPTN